MTKLYLDVDGVLLYSPPDEEGPINGHALKEGVPEFLEWASQTFECLWLTGWAPVGRTVMIERQLLPHLPACAKNFKVANWQDLKTEGITDGDFFWIDDNLLTAEKEVLEANGWMDRFIKSKTSDPSIASVVAELKAKHR